MPSPAHEGEYLRSLIERSGLSVSEFARRVGVSREHVTRSWLKSAKLPAYEGTLWRIVDALGMTDALRDVGYVPEPSKADPVPDRVSIVDAYAPQMIFRAIRRLELTGRLRFAPRQGVMRIASDDEVAGAIVENIAPYSELQIAEPIPTFELCVAAGHWVDVTDNQEAGHHVTEAQNRQGLFRVRVRGDSMTPRFPDDCTCEFRLLRTATGTPDFEAMSAHECYYVQLTDGRATFKCLGSRDRDTLILLPLNKRKYKMPLTCDVADVVRLAAFEWILSKGK